MSRNFLIASAAALQITVGACLAGEPAPDVDSVLKMYVQAVGGEAAVEKIKTREVEADQHHGPKLTYYWQKPNKVLLIKQKEKIGFDGGSGWVLSKKKRVTRLAKGDQRPLQQDADPIQYVYLKSLYSEVNTAPTEEVDGRKMQVLVAPNDLGKTKFYFDAATHLLTRIEETGLTSAYYEHVTEFDDYKDVDGIQFPFRIVHSSTEPGVKPREIRVSKVMQNIELKPEMFEKPTGVAVTFGGKR
ncbi:MAG: hypothetical protein JOY54_14345 [Acidobacteriaceae bacterium]|nr:hypothetical protein [Acidobacteriaceae bacterium]